MIINKTSAALFAAVGIGLAALLQPPAVKPAPPAPEPNKPAPVKPWVPDVPPPAPAPPRKPWGGLLGGAVAPRSPDGSEQLQIDLPESLHQRNSAGTDNAGLCVYASMRHAGRWQGDPAFTALFDWMKDHKGGGNPPLVDKWLSQMCGEKSLAKPTYFHVQANDLEILRVACANGLMPCVSYNFSIDSQRYGGRRIAHMVSLVHGTAKWFAVLDNNYPGESSYEWLNPDQFFRTFSGGNGGVGWAMILLTPAPPPAPHNGDSK